DDMLRSSAELARFLCSTYDIPIRFGSPGILGHSNMPGCSDKNCPGNFPWERFWSYLTGKDRLDITPLEYVEPLAVATVIKGKAFLRQKGSPDSDVLQELLFGDKIVLTGQYKEWYTGRIEGSDSEGFILDSDVWFPRLTPGAATPVRQ
ncbi:MAG: hypothetical protein PHQ23_08095, partial [Candidatus Wallbacteria bacterium]|nr:hypothetical protein [Candidatus Wallbacteria bacterium]